MPEHRLARHLGYRPYSELSPEEKDGVSNFLVQFQKEYGELKDFDPALYWWKQANGTWDSFNTEPAPLDDSIFML